MIIYPAPELSGAYDIVEKLVTLLELRRTLRVSRNVFLARYEKLRAQLNATVEYQHLRHVVIMRAKGKCEKCHSAVGEQMAHRKRVALYPRLALVETNVYWACIACHQLDHREFQLLRPAVNE